MNYMNPFSSSDPAQSGVARAPLNYDFGLPIDPTTRVGSGIQDAIGSALPNYQFPSILPTKADPRYPMDSEWILPNHTAKMPVNKGITFGRADLAPALIAALAALFGGRSGQMFAGGFLQSILTGKAQDADRNYNNDFQKWQAEHADLQDQVAAWRRKKEMAREDLLDQLMRKGMQGQGTSAEASNGMANPANQGATPPSDPGQDAEWEAAAKEFAHLTKLFGDEYGEVPQDSVASLFSLWRDIAERRNVNPYKLPFMPIREQIIDRKKDEVRSANGSKYKGMDAKHLNDIIAADARVQYHRSRLQRAYEIGLGIPKKEHADYEQALRVLRAAQRQGVFPMMKKASAQLVNFAR